MRHKGRTMRPASGAAATNSAISGNTNRCRNMPNPVGGGMGAAGLFGIF
jgi:hypothetical protein